MFWTWSVQYYTYHFEFDHLWYPPVGHKLLPLKLRQGGWIGICPYILTEVWRDNGQCSFPSSNISGHNSAGPIIITDVILEESFAFIPSCSHDPNDLSQVWWIHKWNHLTLPEPQCHTFVSVGALNTTLLVEFKGLFVCGRERLLWNIIIFLEVVCNVLPNSNCSLYRRALRFISSNTACPFTVFVCRSLCLFNWNFRPNSFPHSGHGKVCS